MESTRITVKFEEISSTISKMNNEGYTFIKDIKVNVDGTHVLEFKLNSDSNRKLLVD